MVSTAPLQRVAKQVITVGPDGSMSGLQRKPSEGVDLRQFGRASITRASEILWHEPAQRWTIRVLSEPFRNMPVTAAMVRAIGLEPAGFVGCCVDDTVSAGTLSFLDYDQAVAAEIAFLDALRVAGRLSGSR
jgi:hypothetical protein